MGGIDRALRRVYRRWLRPDPLKDLLARGLIVGDNLKMMEDVCIDWSHCWHIRIGDNVTLAPGVRLIAHDASTKFHLGYTRVGMIDIGDRVFVGAGSTILPGVSVGSDVIIGAGSVVSRDIPDGTIACGNPARPIGTMDEWLKRRRAEMSWTPLFDEEYTMRGGCTSAQRDEMNQKMVDRIGYIV